MDPEEKQEEGAEERKPRGHWGLVLSSLFMLMAGGGYYALTSGGREAQKLVGGEKYEQLSANSAAYNRGTLQKADNFFSYDEADPLSARPEGGAAAPGGEEGKALEARAQAEAGAGLSGSSSGGAGGGGAEEFAGRSGGASGRAGAQRGTFEGKLVARASSGIGSGGAASAKSFSAAGVQSYQQGGVASAKASEQRETGPAAPKKGGVGGVLNALKGTFRASLYGARIASQDAARSWTARSFDASPDAGKSIEYDEKMKAKLDRIDPNSIPKFLRDQDINANDAKSLGVAEVGKPKLDVEGTRQALKEDKKNMMSDMASAAMNPLGNLVGRGGAGGNTAGSQDPSAPEGRSQTPPTGPEEGFQGFASPEDAAVMEDIQLQDYIQTEGYGAECGCTPQAPCCCLPQNTAAPANCPMYGPFLPNDPCDFANRPAYIGDFPPQNTTVMPA